VSRRRGTQHRKRPLVTFGELMDRLVPWLEDDAERNPVSTEAEHHLNLAELGAEAERMWREQFGSAVGIEVTAERLDRFLGDNPDIQSRGWL
jgi:hypothetical protein